VKIAFVAWRALEPAESGYQIRARAIAVSLKKQQSVLVVAPGPEIPGCNHVILPQTRFKNWPLPFNGEVLEFHRFSHRVKKANREIQKFQPDLVWSEGLWSCSVALHSSRNRDIIRIMDVQNIESLVAEKNHRPTLRSRILSYFEKRAYPRFDFLAACSEEDRKQLGKRFGIPEEKVLILPNGISPFESTGINIRPEQGIAEDEKVLLFVGKLDYPPNREAVEWILNDLAPVLGGCNQKWRILLVGGPRPDLTKTKPDASVHITATGRVMCVRPYLETADVCLAPVFSGSGTRIKILEYLSAGKPVIATRKAAEGLDLEDRVHLRFAENAEESRQALKAIFDAPEQGKHLAETGKKCVEEHYQWEPLVQEFMEKLKNRIGGNYKNT
jgi:polysaccharide biosynthesis protein PslH